MALDTFIKSSNKAYNKTPSRSKKPTISYVLSTINFTYGFFIYLFIFFLLIKYIHPEMLRNYTKSKKNFPPYTIKQNFWLKVVYKKYRDRDRR